MGISPNSEYFYEYRYYRLTPELQMLMLAQTDSIFKWLDALDYHDPANPTLFCKIYGDAIKCKKQK